MRKNILLFIVIFLIGIMSYFSPKISNGLRNGGGFNQSFVEGEVVEVEKEDLMYDPVVKGRYRGSQTLKVKILQGEYKGKIFKVYNSLSALHNTYADVGLKAIFTVRKDGEKTVVWLYNLKRENSIYLLSFIFIGLVIILGRRKGVDSLIALTFSGAVIIYILLPLLFKGLNPIVVSICLASIIVLISFLLIGGFNRKTYSAILGTLCGVVMAGVISYIFGIIMRLNGLNMTEGEQLLYIAKEYKLQVGGLLFVSILISSLGAVMDIAMTISSAVNELYIQNPKMRDDELFKSAMSIGKDIIGTMINTLILAFAGSSLPLMMMIWGYSMVYKQFINIPIIAIEIINALAGSIGIIITVPITAVISIILLKREALS